MRKIFGILGAVCTVISFVLLFCMLLLPQADSSQSGGVGAAFAIWIYSAIFALISMLLYTLNAFFSFGRGGMLTSIFRLVFTVAVLILGISIAGSANETHGYVWNIVFAINFLLQLLWL